MHCTKAIFGPLEGVAKLTLKYLIMKTSPCNEYPLTPHFCIHVVKLGCTGVYIFSSPEPKAQRRAYSIPVDPASVCVSVSASVRPCVCG